MVKLLDGVTSCGRGIYRHILSNLNTASEARMGVVVVAVADPPIGLMRENYMCGLARMLLADPPCT